MKWESNSVRNTSWTCSLELTVLNCSANFRIDEGSRWFNLDQVRQFSQTAGLYLYILDLIKVQSFADFFGTFLWLTRYFSQVKMSINHYSLDEIDNVQQCTRRVRGAIVFIFMQWIFSSRSRKLQEPCNYQISRICIYRLIQTQIGSPHPTPRWLMGGFSY
jgi:hypothetical protein